MSPLGLQSSLRLYTCAFARRKHLLCLHTPLLLHVYKLLIFAHTIRLHVFVSYSFSRPPVPCEAMSTFCLGESVSTLANLQYHLVVIKMLYSFLPFFHFSTFICMCLCLCLAVRLLCNFFVLIFLFLHLYLSFVFCIILLGCLGQLGATLAFMQLPTAPLHNHSTMPMTMVRNDAVPSSVTCVEEYR